MQSLYISRLERAGVPVPVTKGKCLTSSSWLGNVKPRSRNPVPKFCRVSYLSSLPRETETLWAPGLRDGRSRLTSRHGFHVRMGLEKGFTRVGLNLGRHEL